MLTMVAAAVTLFYLSAIPVHVSFFLRVGVDTRFGLGISIFEPRLAFRRSLKQNAGLKPPKLTEKLHPADILSSIRTMLKHLRIERICLDGIFGSGDAAVTALVCGGISSIHCALHGMQKGIVHLNLQPDFSADRLRVDLSGMISLRAGHIMIAALLGAIQYGSRRFKAWTSIPSRAL